MEKLEQILKEAANPDAAFAALMPAFCEMLDCDRCFLALRDPDTRATQITHSHSRNPEIPDMKEDQVSLEPENIATIDPLMEIAFRTPEPVFVNDIETAGPEIVNLDFENEVFGHRALIHLPIYWEGKLYGILEPCVFKEPRVWTEHDRMVMVWAQKRLAPLVIEYLTQHPLLLN